MSSAEDYEKSLSDSFLLSLLRMIFTMLMKLFLELKNMSNIAKRMEKRYEMLVMKNRGLLVSLYLRDYRKLALESPTREYPRNPTVRYGIAQPSMPKRQAFANFWSFTSFILL